LSVNSSYAAIRPRKKSDHVFISFETVRESDKWAVLHHNSVAQESRTVLAPGMG